jgi:hypothetical protein
VVVALRGATGTTRRECLDQLAFFNKLDLQRKLDHFQAQYNEARVHSSLNQKHLKRWQPKLHLARVLLLIEEYRWNSRCGGDAVLDGGPDEDALHLCVFIHALWIDLL